MTPLAELPGALNNFLVGIDDPSRKRQRPWVTLSYAQSLDGSIAARRGMPLALSGPATLEITHQLRARHAAILIGIGTLLADDPQLSVRLVPGDDPQPIVLDNHLRTPLESSLLRGQKPPWIITSCQASSEREATLAQAGGRVFRTVTDRIELGEMLAVLAREGIHSVMVEGGARVITSFLQTCLVDLIVLTIAPRFVGGLRAITSMLPADSLRLDEFGMQRYEDDLLIWGRPR